MRVAEGEDAAVGGDKPVTAAGRVMRHPDHGCVEMQVARGSVEVRVAEGEDAAVGGDEPVAAARGDAAMPTTGAFSRVPPMEPWKCASPKVKMPPSDATSQ